jgi:hypothetical protein
MLLTSKEFDRKLTRVAISAVVTVRRRSMRRPIDCATSVPGLPARERFLDKISFPFLNPNLKHPAVHQTTALVLLTMIRFLAYTLSLVFYHRQVRSHARRKCETFHEFAKRFRLLVRPCFPQYQLIFTARGLRRV